MEDPGSPGDTITVLGMGVQQEAAAKRGPGRPKAKAKRRRHQEDEGDTDFEAPISFNGAVIYEYQIEQQVGYFMLDNASSNDVAVDAILQALYPDMTTKKREQRRLRCLGHIIKPLIQDNSTRWNSYFESIHGAILLKDRINAFCDTHQPRNGNTTLQNNKLSQSHWDQLEHLHTALEAFNAATMDTQGHAGTYLFEHFITLDHLMPDVESSE
ncbi:hypothetical protein B0A49_13511, partial [Cryomyces minteri]